VLTGQSNSLNLNKGLRNAFLGHLQLYSKNVIQNILHTDIAYDKYKRYRIVSFNTNHTEENMLSQ
jgi:hypothetical protein